MLYTPPHKPEITAAIAGAVAAGAQQVHVLHRDYETRSRVGLNQVGAHRYAADPSTEISCVAFAVDAGPVQLWTPPNPAPAEFIEAAK
jgi:DNA polymerase